MCRGPERDADSVLSPFLRFYFMFDFLGEKHKKKTSALGEVGLSEVLALQLLLSHPSLWLFDP